MDYTLPISDARANFPDLIDRADSLLQKTYISVKGKIKAAIVNASHLDLMEETLEVLSDPATMKKIAIGKKQVKKGQLVKWENLRNELGI